MTFKMERDIHYKLIKEIEPYPVLYNYNLPDYTSKSITDKTWSEVAKRTGISDAESGKGSVGEEESSAEQWTPDAALDAESSPAGNAAVGGEGVATSSGDPVTVSGRPTRTTRGVPPARFGDYEIVGECKEKWRNIRSSYIRSKKAPPGRSRPKKIYYLARHLAFIEPFLKPRSDTGYIDEPQEVMIETDGQSQDCNFEVENSDDYEDISVDIREEYAPVTEAPLRQPRAGKRRIVEVDQRMPEVEYVKKPERREEPRNISSHPMNYFFLSLLDEFDTMDERQIREFKIKVLQIIEEIKSKKPQASFVSSPESSFITFQASPAHAAQNKMSHSTKKVKSSTSTSFVDNDSNITETTAEGVDVFVKLEHDESF